MASPVHPYSDYGVALRTLRSARGWLALLLFACVLAQFVGFGLMYGTKQPYLKRTPQKMTNFDVLAPEVQRALERFWEKLVSGGVPATAPATPRMPRVLPEEGWTPRTEQGRLYNVHEQWDATYAMAVPVTQTLGLMAAVSQTIIVFLTLLLVLVAQAPGVAQLTRSLIWTTLLLFMVLPWQYLARSYPTPGILYGYDEMMRFVGPVVVGEHVPGYQVLLLYLRFLVWPLIGLLVLLITSERFRAGITLAIGHPLQSIMQGRAAVMVPKKGPEAKG